MDIETILWAEDEDTQLQVLKVKTLMVLPQYKHDFAATSHQLLHKMAENEYDLLVTDGSILYYNGVKLYEEFMKKNMHQRMWLITGQPPTEHMRPYFESIYSKPDGMGEIFERLKKNE